MEHRDLSAFTDEELLLSAFKASPLGIALEDLEGRPLFVNPALCSMLGFSEEEFRRKHCVEFSPADDAKKDETLFEQLRAGAIDNYQLEKHFFRRDGSLIWGRLSISLLRSGPSRIVFATVEDLSEKKAIEAKLSESQAILQKAGGRLIQAHEEERRRIARELHDDIHQQLMLVSINLDRLEHDLPQSTDQIAGEVAKAREQINSVRSQVHALTHRLHPAKLEHLGLAAAAKSLCKELSIRHNLKVDFDCEDVPDQLPKEVSLCFYRVLQEALHNALKHSRSKSLHVSLDGTTSEIRLRVRDFGIGFDPAAEIKGQGLGLTTMQERLELVNGELLIESRPRNGTTISATAPLR